MALNSASNLDITKTLNGEGIASVQGARWTQSSAHCILTIGVYTGALV